VERLTYNPAEDRNVTWSTDQKWIFFESDRTDGNVDIYKMNLETRDIVRLTDHPLRDTDPDAMPYCDWVFFETNRDRNPDVWRMRYDGTQKQNIILGDTAVEFWADHLDHEPGPWIDLFLPLVFQ
jgi:TolB protein